MVPELRERSIWMLTLFSDLFWMTKVTLDCCTSLYTSTLPAPFTLVGAGSACIAHLEITFVRRFPTELHHYISYLVIVFSRSSPGDLRAETIRDVGLELEMLNRKLEDSSWTSWELYL